jgi:D-alanyl-D-alanine carboxypeptidase
MRSRRVPLALAVVAAMALSSCSGDDGSVNESTASTDSTTDGTVEATDAPSADATTNPTDSTNSTNSTDPAYVAEIFESTDSAGSTDGATDGAGVPDQGVIDAAAATFLEEQAAQGVTAFYVAISDSDNGEFVSAYGDAAVDGPSATIDDSFRIGGITTSATATMLLQLVDSGAITLDDTVNDLLPELSAAHPEIAERTVEQLLTMTSGIADYLRGVDGVVPTVVEDPSKVWTPEELIAAGVGAGVTPSTTAEYSATNAVILQLIAESVTGSSLQDLVAQNVTGPLGLEHLYLPPSDDTALPEPATHGYVDGTCVDEFAADGATVDPGTDTTEWSASSGQGGGGMIATIPDLLGWAESTSGSALLDPTTAEQRVGSTEPLSDGTAYPLGITELGPWIGHAGEAFGWEALAVQNPDTGVSVAIAGNGCGGLIASFLRFIDALYPGTLDDLTTE